MRHKLSTFWAGTRLFALLAVGTSLLAVGLGACAPKLGDGCHQGIDCDVRNQRICDRAQPGGYCTIPNCKPGDCGDDGTCVRFRPDEPRLSVTYCMLKCSSGRDCDRDAYVCRGAQQLKDDLRKENNCTDDDERAVCAAQAAEVLDGSGNGKFCISKPE
jgi:hypothetical protein